MAAPKKSALSDIKKRYNITAREARDIATAVGSAAKAVVTPSSRYGGTSKKSTIIKAAGNIAKQVGETATAATKGKKGTTSGKLKTMLRGDSGLPRDVQYKEGKSRTKSKPKELPTSDYAGIRTVYGKYGKGSKVTTYSGDLSPERFIKGRKQRAEYLGEGKKDIAAAKRGDKSYGAKSVAMKKDTAAAKRNQAKKKK